MTVGLGYPIGPGMTVELCDCQEQSEATNGRFSASENTTSLTSLSFGSGSSLTLSSPRDPLNLWAF